MLIFLYGEDTYRLKQKLNEIVEEYKKVHKNGLSLRFIDFSKNEKETLLDDLKNDMRQASMFKEKKLTVMANLFSDAAKEKKFLDIVKDFSKSDDLILLFQEGEIKKTNPLSKFLLKNAKCQEFSSLGGAKLKNWVKKQIENYGGKIDSVAILKLLYCVGNDLWQLDNEIKKLVCFKSKKEIKLEDIGILVRSKVETDIFKTIDAISEKDKKTALELLHKHLEKGDSPLYLLSMINYQFRNLIVVKDLILRGSSYDSIAKKSGLHPYVVRKNYNTAHQFTLEGLKKIYQKIFKVDLDIKTGKIDPAIALDLLVIEI